MIKRLSVIICALFLCQDRKSTRLNSSHSQISYAVFCLKKKTTLVSQASPAAPSITYGCTRCLQPVAAPSPVTFPVAADRSHTEFPRVVLPTTLITQSY